MDRSGFLNVAKPAGMTSRDVVNRVQRQIKPAKAGHAGTLDPLATGVLVIAVGQATRLIEYVQRMRKRYRGTFLLGRSSDTEDVEGTVVELPGAPVPSLSAIEHAANCLVGQILQRPPAFSAIKVQGKRSYDLARAGMAVELTARPVTVYSLKVVQYDYPQLSLDVECSGGTYVRSLGRDLAEHCGTAAVMSALVRTAVGQFDLTEAIPGEALDLPTIAANLLPPTAALVDLPSLVVNTELQERLRHGLSIAAPDSGLDNAEVQAVDLAGNLVAILRREGDLLRPDRVFAVSQ